MAEPVITCTVEETNGIERHHEPVFQGIPFAKGVLPAGSRFRAMDTAGRDVPIAAMPLATWDDGSVQWMGVEFQMSLSPNERVTIAVFRRLEADAYESVNPDEPTVRQEDSNVVVNAGATEWIVQIAPHLSIRQITINGSPALDEDAFSGLILHDEQERPCLPVVERWWGERQHPLRTILRFEGAFVCDGAHTPFRYICRLHAFAGHSTVRLDCTLWNPRAAHHPGGVWDLGNAGSLFLKDLRFDLTAKANPTTNLSYTLNLDSASPHTLQSDHLRIYQDSSGGEHWRSHNHINRHGDIPLQMRGCEVASHGKTLSQGLRATPCLATSRKNVTLAVSLPYFWQNFPKALEYHDKTLTTWLFPRYFQDVFELQGGERKTHSLYLHVTDQPFRRSSLDWIHAPLVLQISPKSYQYSGACHPAPIPADTLPHDSICAEYETLLTTAIDGDQSLFARREIIDEFGWRNFGDLYADHEAVHQEAGSEFISHYNNQYDVIKGALAQFMRTGRPAWFRLADELAAHVADIDIYHTDRDRYEYNHGLFWHTDHHLDAATATHRGSSAEHRQYKDPRLVGTGPSYSHHNYTTGLLYHYWMTGNPSSKEGVLSLAANVVNTLQGSDVLLERGLTTAKQLAKRLLKLLKPPPEGAQTVYEFDGPGRASGNAVNALLDGYLLTSDASYLWWAEVLIQHCVAPDDAIEERDLLNAELRWMYTIFLQSLGKYLDVKHEHGQLDAMFWYARTVLLRYAEWMRDHEFPYLDQAENLEFPNETWSAQEIRKSEVMAHAARYAPVPLREKLLQKSRFFFELCITQLRDDFPHSNHLTRVLALLMTNGMAYMGAASNFTCDEDIAGQPIDFSIAGPKPRYGNMAALEQFVRVLGKTSLRREQEWLRHFLKNR